MQRRNTQQRKIIYEILKNTDIHPSADWIYGEVKKIIPNISLGTVYRNLKVLKEEGLIIEITDGKQSRFDARTDNHFHFKCESCGYIYDIESFEISNLQTDEIENKGFKIKTMDITFNGTCPRCSGIGDN
jgi:Fur family ferric uptake transcriptional regulator/Fur family peroxide stress response transcriptional regulator